MRFWQRLCLALVLTGGLLVLGGAAEGGHSSTPLDGASEGQRGNIALAVKALDGATVKKGDTFSFNETVGPRTRQNGYVSAVNGRGALKLGGGVSQVATTLYLALKQLDGIQYLQKQTYGNQFAGGYAPSGYDAVITDYKQNVDFRFVNGYGDFTIHIRVTDASIECELVAPEAETGVSEPSAEASPTPDSVPPDENAVSDDTQAKDSGGNTAAAEDVPQADSSVQDNEHASPAPEDTADEPVASPIEDDPDVMGSSRIRIDGPEAMLENIQLASSGIYGVVVRRGGTFSFNALVGPNTGEAGYKVAPDGRGEAVTGGGVSVIASGLWLAVKDVADIDVTQITTYGADYSQSYVNSPDDAVQTDFNKKVDFRFRYTGRGSITVYAYILDGELISEIRHNNS